MTELTLRAYILLTSGPRPRSPRRLVADLRTDDDGGMTSETVIIVAILVVIAIGVVTLIGSKIMDKAESISF